jgi:hypothetical protein
MGAHVGIRTDGGTNGDNEDAASVERILDALRACPRNIGKEIRFYGF